MPPIGPTEPSGKISPVAAILWPWTTLSSELLQHLEREGEARGGAADAAGVDADGERQMDVEGVLDEDADDRAPRLAARGHRSHPLDERLLAAPDGHGDRLADLARRHHGR